MSSLQIVPQRAAGGSDGRRVVDGRGGRRDTVGRRRAAGGRRTMDGRGGRRDTGGRRREAGGAELRMNQAALKCLVPAVQTNRRFFTSLWLDLFSVMKKNDGRRWQGAYRGNEAQN